MGTTIITLLAGVASVVGGYFALKTTPNRLRKQAEKEVMKKEEEVERKKQEVRDAVYNQDDERLNQIVSKLLAPLLSAFLMLVGCQTQTQTVYIPTDRRIESCTNSIGIACKAVPDAVFAEMAEKIIELQELKKTAEVDKRLQKQQ